MGRPRSEEKGRLRGIQGDGGAFFTEKRAARIRYPTEEGKEAEGAVNDIPWVLGKKNAGERKEITSEGGVKGAAKKLLPNYRKPK